MFWHVGLWGHSCKPQQSKTWTCLHDVGSEAFMYGSSTHAIRFLPWATAGLEITFPVLQPRCPSTPALGTEVEVATHNLPALVLWSLSLFKDVLLESSILLFFSRPHQEVRYPHAL